MNERSKQQIASYTEWHNRLKEPDNYPILSSLENMWEVIKSSSEIPFDREEYLREFKGDPLGALGFFMEMGHYPPPELLLCIVDAMHIYQGHRGEMTLEEAFYGKPQKGVGNQSAKDSKRLSLFYFHIYLTSKRKTNKSKIQLTEEYILKHNLEIEPDSLLRKYRRYIAKGTMPDI